MKNKTAHKKGTADKSSKVALAESEAIIKAAEAEPFTDDSQELLLKAQKDAELAKAVAQQAISRAFQQSEVTTKRAEVLARAFDDALEGNYSQTHYEEASDTEPDVKKSARSGRTKKIGNNGQNPINVISDITRSIFNNKTVDAGTRTDFYNMVMRQSKQLREMVDTLVNQQVEKKIEKAIDEARSDRVASKLAVQQAQDEAEKARNEAEASRRDAEEAISLARKWIEQAKNEVAAEKKSAEVKASQALQQAMSEAQAEIKKAKDEVTAVKKAADAAVGRAQEESRRAIDKAELSQRKLQETVIQAQQQSYQDICQEMNLVKAEAEYTRKSAGESIARAQEESRKAREEATATKKEADEAVKQAREEARAAREEAEKARQTLAEVVARTQEESRKLKEDAEASILMANEAMKRARQDIISMTMGEITRTRRELEAASKEPGLMLYNNPATEGRDIQERKIDAETPADDKAVVSPLELITEAAQSADKTASLNNNLIILSIPGSLPDIEVDGTHIKQVLFNLIANAVRFSPENSAITVRAEISDSELLIQVKDHGIGIPADEVAAVFDEHFRSASHSNTDGPGPGLHACRQIIEAHGGRIWADSVESRGSTFSFTLPYNTASH